MVDTIDASVRYGFVGLGDQGAPIARRVIDAGYPTVLYARRASSLDPFRDTAATFADSLADLAARCTTIGVCVRTDADAEAVFRGPDGLFAHLREGTTVLVHSTIAPTLVVALAAEGDAAGVIVIDAPVSGGRIRAAAGDMTVMIGATRADFDRVTPVLRTFATSIELLGAPGAGQLCKLLNNVTFTINFGAALRALQKADDLGLDRAAVGRVLTAGSAQSFALSNAVGATPEMVVHAAGLLQKDVDLFREIATDERAQRLLAVADGALNGLTT